LPNCDFTKSTQSWFNGVYDNSNFSNSNLTGVFSRWSYWSNTNLTGSNLTNVTLHGAWLGGTNFTNANLTNADFTQANVTGAIFSGANLNGIRSGGVAGTPASMPARWSVRGGYIMGPNANLTGADLSGLNLNRVDLSKANLTGVRSGKITGTPLHLPKRWVLLGGYLIGPGADLRGANLDNLGIWFGDFTNANLEGASVSGAAFIYCTMTGVKSGKISGVPHAMSGNLVNGYIIGQGVNLEGADLQGANLSGLWFRNANLRSADFTGANLRSADFEGSTIENTDFTDADLTRADLSNSTVSSSRFNNANLTEAKLWNNAISSTEFHGTTLTNAEFLTATFSKIRSSEIVGQPLWFPTGQTVIDGVILQQFLDPFTAVIEGEPTADNILVANVPSNPYSANFQYQWLRDGVAIIGADAVIYKVTGADLYHAISVRVTGSKAGFLSRADESEDVSVVNRYMSKGKVYLSGSAKVGSKLTADVNSWTENAKIAYKWMRDGKAITAATKSTYRLTAADKGHKVWVLVTQSSKGYYSADRTSSKVSVK
jgi:uncharacterized protein YjbI with pentapeptide repeats